MTTLIQQNLVPFETIVAATAGDVEAITAIVEHYDGYTSALSRRPVEDEHNIVQYKADLDMKRRLEIKLITKF